MRWFAIALFALGALSFLAALFFIGRPTGQDLWMAGMALMISAIASAVPWPERRRE
jgi:hypothetical protein